MGYNVPDVNLPAIVMNRRDKAHFISADIKHGKLTNLVGGCECPFNSTKELNCRFFMT
jgi:hypothetical protein